MDESIPAFETALEFIAAAARKEGLVVFAGAGLSVPAPSSLPGWSKLNDAFLEAVCFRLTTFAHPDINGFQLRDYLAQRRNENKVISPDFQAQLAEDECGEDYFRMFQALDVKAWNSGHAAIAGLARARILRAVITTNFDRLIELALAAAGITPRVCKDIADFEGLAPLLTNPQDDSRDVIVIKAHGCVSEARSMVDTLRQRVKGRPRALEQAISTLIGRHATVVVGFSGADLASRPHYLGLVEGAKTSPLFVGMSRGGTQPSDEMRALVDGAQERGRLVCGDLPDALEDLVRQLAPGEEFVRPLWDAEIESPGLRARTLDAEVYSAFGTTLDPLSAANIVAALLQAAGAIGTAAEVLMRTWKHIENAQGRSDGPFLRYVKLLATHLMEHGLLGRNATSLAEPRDGKSGSTAFDLFLYPGADAAHPDAFALAARAAFYGGNAKVSRTMLELVPPRIAAADQLTAINAHLESAHTYLLLREHDLGRESASAGYALAKEMGDLRTIACACAWDARFLAAAKRWDEAENRLKEGAQAAKQLQHVLLAAEIEAGRGYVANRKGDWSLAQQHLATASNMFQKLQLIARVGETLIGYLAAAHYAKRHEEVASAQKDLEAILPALPGLEVDYRLWFVAAYVDAEQFEQARNALDYVRSLAEGQDHSRALEIVADLEAHLASKKAGGESSTSA